MLLDAGVLLPTEAAIVGAAPRNGVTVGVGSRRIADNATPPPAATSACNERPSTLTIELHAFDTPNGRKISVALEEMGLPYRVHVVDITRREQFAPGDEESGSDEKRTPAAGVWAKRRPPSRAAFRERTGTDSGCFKVPTLGVGRGRSPGETANRGRRFWASGLCDARGESTDRAIRETFSEVLPRRNVPKNLR